MDNWFKSRWFIRVVSLAFAIVLYIFVQVEMDQYQNDSRLLPNAGDDVQTVDDVPVNIRIDNDSYVVSGVPEVADVTLEGNMGTITATAKQKNFDVYVDLNDLDPGTHRVDLAYTGIPEDLSVYVEPKTVEVTIEERATKKLGVSVDYIHQDQLPEDMEVGEAQTDPEQVTIASSKDVIDKVAIVKVFVDLADVTKSIDNREVPVKVYDAGGNELNVRVEPENVKASVDIGSSSKKVPVNVQTTGDPPDGYDLASVEPDPSDVKVFAKKDLLKDLDNVTTEKINLDDVTESGDMDVDLALPDGVSADGDGSIGVAVKLTQTREFDKVPVEVNNLDDSQNLTFSKPENDQMLVTASGSQKTISDLTAGDFTASIDAADLADGEHELPITIKGPDGIETSGEFDKASVEITS
ncbi:CdaA regulatory protein CdaR [Barrientosiimonas marina]|uniref:YbbR-like domain-containing protein n=1 Tax=Lentibacillus kimchii TaxID=1542911 RepID=A0ABW2UU17_9BACI